MKILYVTPNPTDPLAFYRGTLPLAEMRKDYPEFEYTIAANVNWANLTAHDLVFMQRPYTSEHGRIVDMCKKWRKPLVLDFDDWLYELSPDNPAVHVYSDKTHYHKAAEMADAIMVTTTDMQEYYEADHGIKTHVVPNAFNDRLLDFRPVEDHSKIVLWRGSNSHTQDLLSVRQGYLKLIKEHTDWQFVFINMPPWWLGDNFENVKTVAPRDALDYMRMLNNIKPAIMAHPLSDCRFNRAKSMCSWLEASGCGSAFVGPDFPEYSREGIINYTPGDSKSFYNEINQLITDPIDIIESAKTSQDIIKKHLLLKDVNKLRYDIFLDCINNH